MSDERIDVVVTDGVDANVEKKLLGIANAADKGENYLNRLKGALASVNTTAVDRLASAMAKADNAQAKLLSAQARLTNAQNAGSIAAEKVALAQQKIATEAARTEAAQQRAAAATSAAALAAQRLQTATAASAGASNAAAAGQQNLAGATNASGAAAGNAGNQWRQYINTMIQANNATAGAAPAAQTLNNGLNSTTQAQANYQRAARQTTMANANIIAQMQDIGVSLAGGQNPLLVLIQQGSQLSYIASTMQGGWRQLLTTMLAMLAPFAAVAAALGVLVGALALFKSELNDQNSMKEFANTLGLTKKEMEKLKDVTITWGDMWEGFKKTMSDNTKIDEAWKATKDFLLDSFKTILSVAGLAVAGLYGNFVGAYRAIKKTWQDFPALLGYLFTTGVNKAIGAIEELVNASIKGINWLSSQANKVLPDMAQIGQIGTVSLSRMAVVGADAAQRVGDTFRAEVGGATREAYNGMNKFLNEWGKNTTDAAKKRLRKQAQDIIDDRGPGKQGPKPKVDNSAEKRAFAIDMLNLKLDDELKRMRMLKDERAIQQRMDQIEQELAQKKIKLNDAERASILGKVTAIEQYKYVQSEMDRIYEETTGPMRTYTATLAAAKELLDKGALSQAQYATEVDKAKRKLAETTDPLFQMKEGMTQAENATKLYGQAVAQANYYESIRQAMIAKYPTMSATYVAGVNAEVDALMKRNAALQQGQFIQQQVGAIVNPILENQQILDSKEAMYAEIDRLRQMDVLSEQSAQQARYALDAKFNQMRLQGASSFFGTMAQLSSSGNKKLAAIGKAAAVAQATIDGFVAVQKALASGPPPWNIINAAAIAAMTGLNVAKIISTPVGSFATGGQFMVQGRGGVDQNNISMNVSRGERVTIETPEQQRAADAAGGSTVVNAPTKVINFFDEKSFLAALDTPEGETVVMNIIQRNGVGQN